MGALMVGWGRVFAIVVVVLLCATIVEAQETVRYYVSEVLAAETVFVIDPDTGLPVPKALPQRLAIFDAVPRPSFSAVIPTHPVTGIALFAWGIAYVKGDVLSYLAVDRDPRNFRLFQGAEGEQGDLDTTITRLDAVRWGDVTGAQKTAMKNKLTELGVPSGDVTATTSLRAILQKVGRHLHPGFDESRLYVR